MSLSSFAIGIFGLHMSAFSIAGYLLICVAALLQGQIWTRPHGLFRRLIKYAVFGFVGIATAVLVTIPLSHLGMQLELFWIIYGGLWLGFAGGLVPYRLRQVARAHILLKPTEQHLVGLTLKKSHYEKQVQIAENSKRNLGRRISQLEDEIQNLNPEALRGKGRTRRRQQLVEKTKQIDELKLAKRRNQARLNTAKSRLGDLKQEQYMAASEVIYFERINESLEKRLNPVNLTRLIIITYLVVGPLAMAIMLLLSGSIAFAVTIGIMLTTLASLLLKGLFFSQIAVFKFLKSLGEADDKIPWISWKGFVSAFTAVFISQILIWVLTSPGKWLEGVTYAVVFSIAAGVTGICSARLYEDVDRWTGQHIIRIGIVLGMVGGAMQLLQ